MWTKELGFIVSPEEQAEVNYRRLRGSKAPDLFCEHCKGYGFVHPVFADKPQYNLAQPCYCLTSDIKANRSIIT